MGRTWGPRAGCGCSTMTSHRRRAASRLFSRRLRRRDPPHWSGPSKSIGTIPSSSSRWGCAPPRLRAGPMTLWRARSIRGSTTTAPMSWRSVPPAPSSIAPCGKNLMAPRRSSRSSTTVLSCRERFDWPGTASSSFRRPSFSTVAPAIWGCAPLREALPGAPRWASSPRLRRCTQTIPTRTAPSARAAPLS